MTKKGALTNAELTALIIIANIIAQRTKIFAIINIVTYQKQNKSRIISCNLFLFLYRPLHFLLMYIITIGEHRNVQRFSFPSIYFKYKIRFT